MGGGAGYDRSVYGSSSTSSWDNIFGTSNISSYKLSRTDLDPSMNSKGKVLKSNSKHPIILMLDVTGSNKEFAKVVYDKLPMFYGQIKEQGYLDDYEISICAVGDAYTDNYPLQIGDFAKGIELDSWIEKLVLEGNGGGQKMESYELAAYYLLKNTQFAPNAKPMLFYIGDEAPYPNVNEHQITEYVEDTNALTLFKQAQILNPEANKKQYTSKGIETSQVFKDLRKKFNDNIYMYLNKYLGEEFHKDITEAWKDILAPEHTVKLKEEKSIIDEMLGTIAMISGKRTLATYKLDMIGRGQTPERIENVINSLSGLEKLLVPVVRTTVGILPTDNNAKRSDTMGIRL